MRFVAPPGMGISTPEGQTVGRYEILETLGKGAMGVVYKARDPLLDRVVAVKTIVSPKGVGRRVKSAYLERFQREAKAAAKMQHPAIVTIFDVGLEGNAPFMVLEYLPGESLADRLDRVRMPLGRGIQIALDLASALGFAHKQRIVHRDVKPANVLHAGENRWKLADFGIARMPDSDLTQVGIFMGTPGYAPPESIRHGQYTSQADVFAWGAVLYELLSGRIPYEGPDTQTTNGYVMKATARSPREYDPSIPEPIAEVTMRALEPSADIRYKDGAEAERALRKAWELCLNSGLVSPASLVAEEVPHERVGPTMHGTPPAAAQARFPDPASAAEPARSPGPQPGLRSPNPAADHPAIALPPRPSHLEEVSDDAKTKVMLRDRIERPAPAERIATPPASASDEARAATALQPGRSAGAAAADQFFGPKAGGVAPHPERHIALPRSPANATSTQPAGSSSRTWVWSILLVVLILVAGAVAMFLHH